MAFIEVSRIAKSFAAPRHARGAIGIRPVLRDVSLSVERGEFVSIVGAMGSGKSTLLSILAGLTTADSGSVVVDGQPVHALFAVVSPSVPVHLRILGRLGFVLRDAALADALHRRASSEEILHLVERAEGRTTGSFRSAGIPAE